MQPDNEERDRTASARRRRRFKAAIGIATAVAAYLDTDTVRRPMHNSALRGMDKDCVGALDGTHIPCMSIGVPNPAVYRNRKGVNSQNILAACSFDMKFTYILSGWEGSAHDARVLTDALNNCRSKFQCISPGKYYLVDAAYANNDHFLAPYRGGTYHLPDYRRRSGGFWGPRDIFNYKHSSLRNYIERAFGVWKVRFPILRLPNNTYPMDK